jgi:hypothetical protein
MKPNCALKGRRFIQEEGGENTARAVIGWTWGWSNIAD